MSDRDARVKATKRRIRELAAGGCHATEIGRVVGLTRGAVRYHARMMGVEMLKGKPGSRPLFRRGSMA
jgi:predicted transcriptional regulator